MEHSRESASASVATAPCEVAAYYFPQYHADPRNERWHGRGWTEWELLRQARPRFPGHRQPIVPAWGYFDESDPDWAAREIEMAADHGITAFLYDWYWYEDGPFLQDGLERGFLRAENTERLKFALMWANHDWLNIHPAPHAHPPVTLVQGRVTRAAFERMTDHIVTHYFTRPNYLTLGGVPYFSIYELGTFIAGMGGLEAAGDALDAFRAKVRAAGFPGLHVNAIVWGVQVLPNEVTLRDPAHVVSLLGFSSVSSYAWVHHYESNADGFPVGSYSKAAAANSRYWDEARRRFAIPYFPNVSMGWDPSPRTVQSDGYEPGDYPWHAILGENTPHAFQDALRQAHAFVERDGNPHPLITLNAWNEWTEGSYLLPDTVHGTAYLEAVRTVFGGARVPRR